MRSFLTAVAAAALPVAATAAVTLEEEGLARCYADYSMLYELLVPLRDGETEEQAIARLDSHEAAIVRLLGDLARESALRMNSWSHLANADMERLMAVTQEQSDDWVAVLQGATDAELDAIADELMDQTETCTRDYFPNRLSAG